MGASVVPVADPLAAYRAQKQAVGRTPAQTGDIDLGASTSADPLASYRAAKAAPPAHDYHAEFKSGALATRMANANARDRANLADEQAAAPSYGERLATHILNTGQGIPGVERVEAAAGAAGSRATAHPMSYDESLKTMRDRTGGITTGTNLAEHLMGSIAVAPFLRGGMIAQGAELGAADQLGSADKESIAQRGVNTAIGGAEGAALGAALRGGTAVASRVASKILPKSLGPALSRITGEAPRGDESEARTMLANALRTGGVSPGAAAATVPVDQPTTMMELGSRNVPAVVRAARNVPTATAAQTTDRFLTERSAGTGKRLESALSEATGHTATDTWLPVEQIVAKRAAEAKPLYEEAYAHGQINDQETVAEIQRLLKEPVFSKAWKRGEALAKVEDRAPRQGPPSNDPTASSEPMRQLSIRDGQGRIRRDLRGVSDESLDAEWQRLAEMNAREEGSHAAVEESGYRHDYYELPRTERLGRKGQEDLPDADGMVDAETLARDNKTVSDYRRGSMVRASREQLMQAIQTELASRPSSGDFSFGANKFVPNRDNQTALPTVRQVDRWKKGLDATINSGFGSENALSKDEARVYRGALNNVLARVDAEVPAYAKARATFRGNSELKEAAESGAKHFSPSVPTGALERELAGMSPGERDAYQSNALNALATKIRQAAANPDLPEAGRDANIVQRLMGSEDAGQRLGMLFKDEPSFQAFLKRMEDEALYPKTNKFLRNQSTTNAQQLESGTSPAEWAGAAVDAVRHPFRTIGRKITEKTGMPPGTANEVAQQATATGDRLKNILAQMESDHAARELGRRRLTAATRAALVGGEQGFYGFPHPYKKRDQQ